MMIETLFVVRKLSRRIKAELEKIKRLEDLKLKTSQELDGLPKSHYGAGLIANLVAEICDRENLITDLKCIRALCRVELVDLLEKIFCAKNLYFELQTMIYRYAYDISFVGIARRLEYSLQSVYRFHIHALSILNFTLPDLQIAEQKFFLKS